MLKATERARGAPGPGRGKAGSPALPAFSSEPRSDGSGKGTFGGRGRPPKIGPSPELGPKNDKPTLRVTERARGTRGQLKGKGSGGHLVGPPENKEPTLSDLGLTKKHFSRRRENLIRRQHDKQNARRHLCHVEVTDCGKS